MPPPKKRNLFILILDICEPAFVRNVLDMFLVYKGIGSGINFTNDEAVVVLMNCSNLDQNIKVVADEPISLKGNLVMDLYNEHINPEAEVTPTADWLEAVAEGIDLVDNIDKKSGIQTYYCVIISSLPTPSRSNWKEQVKELSDRDIRSIICIDQEVKFDANTYFEDVCDLKTANEDVLVDMNSNIKIALKMFNYCHGVVTSPRHFLDFVRFMAHPAPKQDFQEGLVLGKYKFATCARKIIEVADHLIHRSFGSKKSKAYFIASSSADQIEELEHEQPVDVDDIVKGFNFNGTLVVRPHDVASSFKYNGSRSFKVIGFINKTQLSEMKYGGLDTHCVTANLKEPRAHHFVEFVDRVAKMGKCIIASRVYNVASKPKLYVLLPQTGGWCLMNELPRKIRRVCGSSSSTKEEVPEVSEGMLSLRNMLLSNNQELFHPKCGLGLRSHLIVNNVRREVGYAQDAFKSVIPIELPQNEKLDEELTEIFSNVHSQTEVKAEELATDEDMEEW